MTKGRRPLIAAFVVVQLCATGTATSFGSAPTRGVQIVSLGPGASIVTTDDFLVWPPLDRLRMRLATEQAMRRVEPVHGRVPPDMFFPVRNPGPPAPQNHRFVYFVAVQ